MLNRLSIRTKLLLVAVVPLVAMAVLAVLAYTTLTAVKVGGPAEQKLEQSQGVESDVLPPPLFVVEPFLVISLASEPENAGDRDELLARYEKLKAEYKTAHEKWIPVALPADVRASLLETSYASATQFFDTIDREVVPLIEKNDDTAVQVVTNKVLPIYNQHRAQIEEVLRRTLAWEDSVRADTSSTVRYRTFVFVLGLAAGGLLALLLGLVIARTIRTSIARLRRAAIEDLPRVMEELRNGDDDALSSHTLEPVDLGTKDELAEAADAFNAVIGTAIGLAGEQTVMRKQTSEMFVNLGRRNQNLVSRQLRFIDSLERTETDGDRLAELFRLDNLATRMRRNAESLLVLAGVEAPRRWRKPVRLYDVVRAAMAEIEDFRRVKIGTFDEVQVQGASVANVTHLLAELVENAARFSPPDADVAVSGVDTGNGYLLGIHDRGLGMAPDVLVATNERLHVSRRLDEVPTAYLGLYVVARLAAREGITVDLESPEGDGLTAWVRLPISVLAADEKEQSDDTGEAVSALRRLEVAARADQLALPAAVVDAHPTPVAAAPVASPILAPPAPAPLAVPSADAVDLRWGPPADLPAALPAPSGAAPAAPLEPPLPTRRVPGASVDHPVAVLDLSGTPRQAAAPAPVAAQATAAPTADQATKSGFKKRVRTAAPVDFDRFDAKTPPTGQRSAEDMKDRLDRFSAGKRYAAAATAVDDPSPEDDE